VHTWLHNNDKCLPSQFSENWQHSSMTNETEGHCWHGINSLNRMSKYRILKWYIFYLCIDYEHSSLTDLLFQIAIWFRQSITAWARLRNVTSDSLSTIYIWSIDQIMCTKWALLVLKIVLKALSGLKTWNAYLKPSWDSHRVKNWDSYHPCLQRDPIQVLFRSQLHFQKVDIFQFPKSIL